MLRFCTRLAAVVVFMAMAGTACAEGFALYEYSARGVALGGAVMARKPDASAVAYNPALIARLPGIHLQGGVAAIAPSGKMETEENGVSESTALKSSTWLIPSLYYTHQISDDFTFGVGEFSRFGLGFEYPHDWPGRRNVYEVNLKTMSINPNIAWAVTDKLSLAAGPEFVYVNMDLKKRAVRQLGPFGNMEVDSNIQAAEDWGLGFNIAGHYQFNEQWAVGVQYRSQVQVTARGDVEYTLVGTPASPMGKALAQRGYNQNFHDGDAHATVVLPDSVAGGISWTPIPELSFEAGAVWTRWSTFKSLRIHLPEPINISESHKDWKDTWRLNFGVEYEPLDWLTLRAGYVYDRSPMTSQFEDYLVPTDDRSIYSVGVGFHWDQWTVDLAYAFIDANNRYYSERTADGVLDSRTRDTVTDIFAVSLGYAF